MRQFRNVIIHDAPHAHWLPSVEEEKEFERLTMDGGTAELELMKSAGREAASEIVRRFRRDISPDRPAVILCGNGNNGGDGLVIFRCLREIGLACMAVVVRAARYSESMKAQLEKPLCRTEAVFLEEGPIETGRQGSLGLDGLSAHLRRASIVVDALLGTGQKDAPRALFASTIAMVNELKAEGGYKVVSIDVPSGVDAAIGTVFEPHISADLTLAVEHIKRGLIQYPARACCGDLQSMSIGLKCEKETEFAVLGPWEKSLFVVPRRPDCYKSDFGKVLVLGGSRAMPGASVLSARAALRSGAGLVTKIEFFENNVSFPPEIMLAPMDPHSTGWKEECEKLIGRYDSLVVGPGAGLSGESREILAFFLRIIEKNKIKAVIDADALTFLSQCFKEGWKVNFESAVLTPHPGEMARLLDTTIPEIQKDRYAASATLRDMTGGATVVLKGASSIICGKEKSFVNLTGNPWMAIPGSGDVLAGIIGTFMGQGKTAFDAAVCGTWYHGLSGDIAHEKTGSTIIASDIIESIPSALSEVDGV